MSAERIDPEALAAFLDGTTSPEEREGVLRALVESKEAYASFLEASAIQRELTADASVAVPAPSGAPAVQPARSSALENANARWFRRWWLAPAAVAAGIAAIVFARGVDRGGQGAIQLVQATSLTREKGPGTMSRTLGDTWDRPPWSVRGNATSTAVRPVAVRAGARYAQLELASHVADSAAVVQSAESLAQALTEVEGSASIVDDFRTMARAPDFGGSAGRAEAAGQLRALLGAEDWFDLGVWAETARLAVAGRATDFFEPNGRGVSELRRILEPHTGVSTPDDAEWAPVVDALRPLIEAQAGSPNDLDAVGARIRTALTAAAR